MSWQHGDEVTLSLPISELALQVLRDFKLSNGWNRRNWLLESEQWGKLRSKEAKRALGEAWAWLESRGLIAPDPEQTAAHACFVTRLGEQALASGITDIDAGARLGMQLHPRLARIVERQFLMGERELAVFAAMKSVEVRVRELSGLGADLVGTALMQEAFKPGGLLADSAAERGEQVGRMELFKGAMGTFKNPSSHRPVDYEDPVEAAEIVLFADLLHRVLDRYI